ncbi:SUZ domain-containing protein 1 [Schistocerca piceifrons]|uniref:SUZ domain-containing protein 1 n=1 Tax=Schistocerca piceifrons TaxID=274613 RepID=UPI001F5ED562|nr:SUZ domain-containing protein 1 [Schistocerca piceifrons]
MAASEELDVVDSWEEIEDSGVLDRKFLPSTTAPEETENVNPVMSNGPIILQSNPFPMPEPAVKILKRPQRTAQGNGNGHLLNGDTKPRQPVRTLQQREQAYAEARLRILGEARSPEEQHLPSTDDRISKIQTKMEVLRTSETGNILRHPKGPDGTRGFNLRR